MLGRFVCPAARLDELRPYRESLFQSGETFQFSVLGRGGNTADEFLAEARLARELRGFGADAHLTAIEFDTEVVSCVVRVHEAEETIGNDAERERVAIVDDVDRELEGVAQLACCGRHVIEKPVVIDELEFAVFTCREVKGEHDVGDLERVGQEGVAAIPERPVEAMVETMTVVDEFTGALAGE